MSSRRNRGLNGATLLSSPPLLIRIVLIISALVIVAASMRPLPLGIGIADKLLLQRTSPPNSTSHLFVTNQERKWNTFVAQKHLWWGPDKSNVCWWKCEHMVCSGVRVCPTGVLRFSFSKNQRLCDLRLRKLLCFQGDKEAELGLPFSPLCDRKSTMVAQSQIGEWHW